MTSESALNRMKETHQKASDEYARYEQACAEIRKENAALLKEFAGWMRQQGVSERTVGMHSSNAHFSIQEFLLS